MENDQTQNLVIIHFNDVYNIQPDKYGKKGFINFYDYVQNMKIKYPQSILAFSGDCFAPSKLSRIFKGQQMEYCINKLGIDIACYGNHDFDFTPEHSAKLVKNCKFPWLLGNIKYIDTGQNIGRGLDYYIMSHQNIKIGFLGLAGPDFNGRLISVYKNKLKYHQIKQYALKICQKLRQEKCQLIIALTHCRRPIDQELAKAVPQIDIILGGHDHSVFVRQINKMPIVKSGSDFQNLSIIKIGRDKLPKNQNKQIISIDSRRWNFQIQTHYIPKTEKAYPQLEEFIKKALLQRINYEKQNSIEHNKPKQERIQTYQSNWLIDYGIKNNRQIISLKVGLSAQVCLAKYIAFKRNCFYMGFKRATPAFNSNYVEYILDFIYEEYKSHKNNGKTVLYSPGICNVPYLVQTSNFVYLPSHFLVGVTHISSLQEILKEAQNKGYKCYAVIGYDPFFKTQLCAWIKFIEPPKQYIKLIKQFTIQNVIMMSVHDMKGNHHGAERNCRLISGIKLQKERQQPQIGDIYINFIGQDNPQSFNKQIRRIGELVKDRPKQWWIQISKQQKCCYIHDWESGIDCIHNIQHSFQKSLSQNKIKYFKIVHPDSWQLYMTAYHLGKAFIEFNYVEKDHEVKGKGLVFNQYIMSNPTYQLNYGYIPILYWQFYPKNQERILREITEEQQQYKRWFNNHKGTSIKLVTKDSHIINTDHQGKQLATWITKYAPIHFNLKYLPFDMFIKIMSNLKILVQCQ